MTVSELITFLQAQPQDLQVAYRCYSEQVLLETRGQRVEEACAELCDKFIEDETPELIRAGLWKEYL